MTTLSPEQLWPALRKAFVQATQLLWLPAIEFLLMRLFVRNTLGLRFGWRYVTDFDLVCSLPFAFGIGLFVLERARPLEIGFKPKAMIVHALAVAAFLMSAVTFERTAGAGLPLSATLGFVLTAVSVLFSAIAVNLRMGSVFTNPNRWALLPMVLIAGAPLYSSIALQHLWPFFSNSAAGGTCLLLKSVLGNVECFSAQIPETRLIVRHALMGITIGKACGGLDGFFLSLYTFLLLWLVAPSWFSKRQWVLLVLLTLPITYLLNTFRIAGLFLSAILLESVLGPKASVDLMLALFHTHSGWILFFVGNISLIVIAHHLLNPAPRRIRSKNDILSTT